MWISPRTPLAATTVDNFRVDRIQDESIKPLGMEKLKEK